MSSGFTARNSWFAIEIQFLETRETHALYLDAQFCLFVQSDLSIVDYYM